jgi:hypothetical protein
MFFRHNTDKLFIPFVVVIVLLVLSYRPKYRLRSEMPAAFFLQENASAKPSLEQKIAWAYWENAQMDIQWKYSHGRALPLEPPAEFQVSAKALGPGASDPATRLLYWHRLQQLWNLPETWKKEYEFDWSWMHDPAATVGDWIRGHTPSFMH